MRKIVFALYVLAFGAAFADDMFEDVEPIYVELIESISKQGTNEITGGWFAHYTENMNCEDAATMDAYLKAQATFLAILQGADIAEGKPSLNQRIQLASTALAYNSTVMNTALLTVQSEKINAIKATYEDSADAQKEIKKTVEGYSNKIKQIQDKGAENKQAIDSRLSDMRDKLSTVTEQFNEQSLMVTELRKQVSEATGNVSESIELMKQTMEQMKASAQEIASLRYAIDKMMMDKERFGGLVGAGIDSPAIGGLTNTLVQITKYLGYEAEDGEDGEDKNQGLTFIPPNTKGGSMAETILKYLDSYGMLSFVVENPDDEQDADNPPFKTTHYLEQDSSGEVTASFGAPVNWVDGTSISVDNGVMKMVRTGSWIYDGGKFIGCSCHVGSKNLTQEEIPWTNTGAVYAHIDVSVVGQPRMTLSSTGGVGSDTMFVYYIATISEKTVTDENGNQTVIRYASASRNADITVYCYE